jgi:hypothetical protein
MYSSHTSCIRQALVLSLHALAHILQDTPQVAGTMIHQARFAIPIDFHSRQAEMKVRLDIEYPSDIFCTAQIMDASCTGLYRRVRMHLDVHQKSVNQG